MTKSAEPRQLRRGKQFHRQIQDEWLEDSQDGRPCPERSILRLDGSTGRMDIIVEELGDGFVSIVEIKGTDWDRIAERNVRRNVRRQIRQVWSYIDAVLERLDMEVCPGIVFPTLPEDPSRVELIESMFNEEGIQVVWHDETIEKCRERHDRTRARQAGERGRQTRR